MSRFNSSKPKQIKPTTQQQAIIDSTEPAILVNAVAGSGKTSILMQLAENYSKGVYLAFNKAIVKEVVPKLPLGWSCKTFNSFGLAITKGHYPNAKVNFNKYSQYAYNQSPTLAVKHMSLNGNISDDSWKSTCERFKIGFNYIREAQDILKTLRTSKSKNKFFTPLIIATRLCIDVLIDLVNLVSIDGDVYTDLEVIEMIIFYIEDLENKV